MTSGESADGKRAGTELSSAGKCHEAPALSCSSRAARPSSAPAKSQLACWGKKLLASKGSVNPRGRRHRPQAHRSRSGYLMWAVGPRWRKMMRACSPKVQQDDPAAVGPTGASIPGKTRKTYREEILPAASRRAVNMSWTPKQKVRLAARCQPQPNKYDQEMSFIALDRACSSIPRRSSPGAA